MTYPHAELTEAIIGAAIEVHRHLGPGLLESVYESCLARELETRQITFQRQVAIPIRYKGEPIDGNYRIDLLVHDRVVIELKSVDELTKVHEAQLLTYLKLSQKNVGLLINFNTDLLKNGLVRRIV